MKYFQNILSRVKKITFITLLIFTTVISRAQQKIGFGIHADPVIGWFSSDIRDIRNDGARPGFNFGLTFNRYFSQNYSFSTRDKPFECRRKTCQQ